MKISTKGRYGLRLMLNLTLYGGSNVPVYLSDIAKREGISEKYLEQIVSPILKAGLIKSVRGRKGGYFLAKPASQIKLSEIIQILEGPFSVVDCVKDEKFCNKISSCAAREIWVILNNKIEEVLSCWTLQDLCEIQKKKTKEIYYI